MLGQVTSKQVNSDVVNQLTLIREHGLRGLKDDGSEKASISHLKQLDKLRPKTGLSVEFCEAFVAHATLCKRRPVQMHKIFYNLRDKCEAKGETKRFETFESTIRKRLDGMWFSQHGFSKKRLESVNEKKVYETLQSITEKFTSIGYDVFANAGTLLGLTRDGKLIGHDDDIDLVIILGVRKDRDAVAEWLALPEKMKAIGVELKQEKENSAVYKLPKIDGFQVDLFPSWGTRQRYNIYPYSRKKLHYKDIMPLKKCKISGLNIPAKPKKVLELNYGEGWTVPDPGFKIPWRKYKKTFKTFLDILDTSSV